MKDAMWQKIAIILALHGKELGQAMKALKTLLWWNDGKPRLNMESSKWMEKVPALDANTVDGTLLLE